MGWRINHANTKPTGYSRTSPHVEQPAQLWTETAPRKPKHVWAISVRLELALFKMATDSKLRGCDLMRMKVVDVMACSKITELASVLQS